MRPENVLTVESVWTYCQELPHLCEVGYKCETEVRYKLGIVLWNKLHFNVSRRYLNHCTKFLTDMYNPGCQSAYDTYTLTM